MGKISKKLYYFVICNGYSYCVPKRDLKTAEPNSIKVGDEVQFKYNSLTFTGRVQFISASESEVMEQIKKEKLSRIPKDDSFHEDKPRKSALKQREMMSSLKHPSKPLDNQEVPPDPKTQKKALKKLKDERKSEAALLTESVMLDQAAGTVSHWKPGDAPLSDTGLNEADSATPGSNNVSWSDADANSGSSVDVHPQVKKAEQSEDIKGFRELEAAGMTSDDSNGPAHANTISPASDGGAPIVTPDLPLQEHSLKQLDTIVGAISRSSSRESDRMSHKRSHSNSPDSKDIKRIKRRSTSRDSNSSKASRRSSSNSSTSTQSSSSSSSCSSSSDEESEKRRHKKRKSKKKKSGRSKKDDSSEDSESESDSTDRKKRKKSKKRSKKDDSEDSESESDAKDRKKKKKSSKKTSKKVDSVDSESESDAKDRKKKKKSSKKRSKNKKNKNKKNKKNKKKKDNSESESESDSKDRKKKKKSKKRRRRHAEPVKRNLDVYPGKMYNYSEDSEDVVRVHKNHAVYLPKAELEKIIKESDTMAKLIKALCKCIFTREALRSSTAQGFPNRIVGLRQRHVKPRLDPVGRAAILEASVDIQENKKSWRPRTDQKQMSAHFSQSVKKLGDGK